MIIKRFLLAAAALLVLGLTGCGGSDSDDNQTGTSPGASDAFFAKVQALIATSPENTEPESIESVAVTTPETIEPAAL